MSVIERGLYVAVGAADLAAEKVRELPAVKALREQRTKLRETSMIDQARELEPKLRKQYAELAARGEGVIERVRTEAKDLTEQLRDFPAEARKQLQDLPETTRKQVTELRDRIEQVVGRSEGTATKAPAKAAPAPKTTAKVS